MKLTQSVILTLVLGCCGLASATTLHPGDIVVADDVAKSIFLIDPVSGLQTALSTGGLLTVPFAVAVDWYGNIFVADAGTDSIIRVNPLTGVQSLLASGGSLQDPLGITIDGQGNVVVADAGTCSLIRINPSSGIQSVISSGLSKPQGVALAANGRFLVADAAFGRIVSVDQSTGIKTTIPNTFCSTDLFGVGQAKDGDVVFADADGAPGRRGALIKVNPSTGTRTTVASAGYLTECRQIAVEASGNILVADPYALNPSASSYASAIVRVNPSTGLQTLVSSGGLFQATCGVAVVPSAAAPSQPPRQDPTPLPVTGSKNLVMVTHGACTSEDDYQTKITPFVNAIKDQVGSTWDVLGHDWAAKSHTIWPIDAIGAAAELDGRFEGVLIANSGYENVHLIGHCAGARFVAAACEAIKARAKELGKTINVQCTFLDAFVPDQDFLAWYGKDADWTDQYIVPNSFVPWPTGPGGYTGVVLPNAFNVDVTRLGPHIGDLGNHQWPLNFYRESVDPATRDPLADGYGFMLSKEGGGQNGWSSHPNDGTLKILGTGSTSGSNAAPPTVRHDTVFDISLIPHISSDTGTVTMKGTGFSLVTGSPVWLITELEVAQPVDRLTFKADFTSAPGAEGLLAVYWDNQLLGTIDERYALNEMDDYTLYLPSIFDSGTYLLAFRLDPYTEVASSVEIGEIATGCAVPEPATLSLLALGGLAVLRRRWRK